MYPQFEKRADSDCYGNDINNIITSSPAECLQLCSDDPTCVAAIVRVSDIYCWTKTACDVNSLSYLADHDVYYKVPGMSSNVTSYIDNAKF